MVKNAKPLRRVVTGHDANGKSCVIYDSDAPNVYQRPGMATTLFTELWTIENLPATVQYEAFKAAFGLNE